MPETIHARIGQTILIADPSDGGMYSATIYPALPGMDVERLGEAPPSVLAAIPHLRIDTVNSCNLKCVFCHSDFSAKAKNLEIDEFARAISLERFSSLERITMGCAYEPLLGKNFEKYPTAISHLRGRITADIVTNGVLFDRKDIGPWIDFGLGTLYVSVYSHLKEVYERTGRAVGSFKRVEQNLIDIRRRFPDLNIKITNPVSKSNDVDLAGFCRWAFETIGVNAIDLRRAVFVDTPSPGYPAYSYTAAATSELGRSPALTDTEWRGILDDCSEYLSGEGIAPLVKDITMDSALLEAPNRSIVVVPKRRGILRSLRFW